MVCPKALSFLDQYYEALNAFHSAREGGSSGDRDLRFAELSRARMEYWKHVDSHGCRTASNGGYHLATERKLREQMEQARRAFNEAQIRYRELTEIAKDCESASDGTIALGQATRMHAKARQDYREAFKRFTDYVVHGKLSADPTN
jgi:hypothetical protein